MNMHFDAPTIRKRPYGLSIFCALILLFNWATGKSVAQDVDQKLSTDIRDGLRGVYYGTGDRDEQKDSVGRLAIELAKETETRTVRVDHHFRTGDRFRFKLSSNRDGWLYILHSSAGREMKLLWPRTDPEKENGYLDANQIEAGRTYTIPPSPGIFLFDDEVGAEHFYVMIASEKKLPQLRVDTEGKSPAGRATTEDGKGQRIVNFGVRSGPRSSAPFLRGVVYDPGQTDDDPYLYFAPSSDDEHQPLFMEFQLKHQER